MNSSVLFKKLKYFIVVVLAFNAIPLFASQLDFNGKDGLASLYGLSLYKDANNYYLVLHVKEDTKTVADYVVVPAPPDGYKYEIGLCTLDGVYKEKLAALLKYEWVEIRKNVIGAWMADEKGEKLITVDPGRVYCYNDGWNA